MRVSYHPLLQHKVFHSEGRDSSKVGYRSETKNQGYRATHSDKTPRRPMIVLLHSLDEKQSLYHILYMLFYHAKTIAQQALKVQLS